MSSMLPVALYGLKVPAGNIIKPAIADFQATFHITMASIDPSASPAHSSTTNGDVPQRSILKLIYDTTKPSDDEDESDDEYLREALMGAEDGEDEDDDEDAQSSDDDEEKNGGPSDPSKTKKARKEAATAQMLNSLRESAGEESDEDVDASSSHVVNGVSPKDDKGKGKAVALLQDDDEDEEDEMMEVVLCTLDPHQHYQQPLDITIPEGQNAYFQVSGSHPVYLTGNYVVPPSGGYSDMEEDSDDYDMSPDIDELEDGNDEDEESDELDDLEDPRITEVESEDEAPKLIKAEKAGQSAQKGKNKRAAELSDDEPVTLDAIMYKSLRPAEPAVTGAAEPKLSKKQLKKLKNNTGKAVEAAVENKNVKKEDSSLPKADKNVKTEDSSPPKSDKKVQFATNLEQGPSNGGNEVKPESKADAKPAKQGNEKLKPSLGQKTLQNGVQIDDRKLGTGPAAKKGDKVGMRYIGKLTDGKVFDANKKGAPFRFTLGVGEVIQGWDIGVQGMSVGGERRIEVPAKMAYGSKAQPGIPANSPLKFDVKMLSIN